MKKSIGIILTALVFCYLIAIPCYAQTAIEESLSKGVSFGAEGKFDQARKELEDL